MRATLRLKQCETIRKDAKYVQSILTCTNNAQRAHGTDVKLEFQANFKRMEIKTSHSGGAFKKVRLVEMFSRSS